MTHRIVQPRRPTLFRRTKQAQPDPAASSAADPTRQGGKGRPTPTRKEAEAAARARAKAPAHPQGDGAARSASRAASPAARSAQAMKTGDERYFLARDKGPVRRFVRDFVDVRFSFVELMIPVMILVLVLGYSGSAPT